MKNINWQTMGYVALGIVMHMLMEKKYQKKLSLITNW